MTPFQVFFTLFSVLTVNIQQCISKRPECEAYIDYINANQNLWTAGKVFDANSTLPDFEALPGLKKTKPLRLKLQRLHSFEVIASLPENFDARNKWPNCPSLNEIRDQGNCGSCWAFGAVAAMTDRVCTYSNGTKNFHFSAEDIVSCGNYGGCNGGLIESAWKYWVEHGIVSGGGYNSKEGCQPYSIPSIAFDKDGALLPTPKCVKACQDGYNVTYEKDKQFGKRWYFLPKDEDQIKAEIYQNGPVEAGFFVYLDFLCYQSGVYRHVLGNTNSKYHAVKILGWGVEKGTKYWLAANEWSPHWGDKGFFKIIRGIDYCDIETHMVAGEPLL